MQTCHRVKLPLLGGELGASWLAREAERFWAVHRDAPVGRSLDHGREVWRHQNVLQPSADQVGQRALVVYPGIAIREADSSQGETILHLLIRPAPILHKQ